VRTRVIATLSHRVGTPSSGRPAAADHPDQVDDVADVLDPRPPSIAASALLSVETRRRSR
jgi:hypothetical protein